MGSGKSEVGARLASLLGWDFVDLDSYIEHKTGRKIADIFNEGGEAEFRAIEMEALRDVTVMHTLTHKDMVLALGGGTITINDAKRIILSETTCIYLKASAETLRARISPSEGTRPMLKEDFGPLLERREKLYGQAPLSIETDRLTIEQVADKAMELIKERRVND